MKWLSLIAQMIVPVVIVIYTVNFGRWMALKKIRSGAFGAYLIAATAFGLTVWVLLKNNL
ncbi:hypothetical protein [Effusibacillus dendaii]|uniref:Uncharacterized protein n=1 Tax=Effusibacillus dendaii TaxID=2743772 RepID=A0A7I8DDS6_9BACL|nr:hypothetical protein [Effusibacillus dendaii]BCJ86976.1 hypothetical protein skT53_19610 [Effusibacillus dendaii]